MHLVIEKDTEFTSLWWNLWESYSINMEKVNQCVNVTWTHPLHGLNKKGGACRIIILATPTPDTTPSPPVRALTRHGIVRNHILLTGYHSLALFARVERGGLWRWRRRSWIWHPMFRRRRSIFLWRWLFICGDRDPRIGSITRAFDLLPPPKGFAWIANNPIKLCLAPF